MPIYEHQCPNCGIVEILYSIKADPPKRCPKCGEKIKRLISGGIGIAMDTDKLWEPDPSKPRAERRGDLKKHEADLFGIPPQDRDRFRQYKRGKGDPREM